MRLSEKKTVEDPTLRHCKKHWPRLKHYKMNGMGKRSWPDRMFLIPGGCPFFIEFKSPGEEPTLLQANTIKGLTEDGYDVEVHDDKDKAIEAIAKRIFGAAERVYGSFEIKSVGPTRLPKEGHQVHDRAHGGSTVPRSRTRKD
jgi:hypothetical protein